MTILPLSRLLNLNLIIYLHQLKGKNETQKNYNKKYYILFIKSLKKTF